MIGGTEFSGKSLLCLLPSDQDRVELDALASSGLRVSYFDDPEWRSYEPALPGFDPLRYIEQCVARVRAEHVDALFYADDLANFVAAVVAERTSLIAPSAESMFLTNHKHYCRMKESRPIGSTLYDLQSGSWRGKVAYPAHIKPPSLFFSLLQNTVRSDEDLDAAASRLALNVPTWEAPFKTLFMRYVDRSRYPLAGLDTFVAEEFVEDATQHAVEGWTNEDGNSFIWAVSDNNYAGAGGSSLDNNSVPSRLGLDAYQEVCQVAFDTVARIGIRRGFWNAEIWIRADGRVQVTEVNGRICASMTPLYKWVYGHSQYRSAARLACGLPVTSADHRIVPQRVGGMFAIAAKKRGRVSALLRLREFESIGTIEGVIKTKLMFAPETEISWHQTGGSCCLARAWIVGETYSAIAATAAEIRRRLVV